MGAEFPVIRLRRDIVLVSQDYLYQGFPMKTFGELVHPTQELNPLLQDPYHKERSPTTWVHLQINIGASSGATSKEG